MNSKRRFQHPWWKIVLRTKTVCVSCALGFFVQMQMKPFFTFDFFEFWWGQIFWMFRMQLWSLLNEIQNQFLTRTNRLFSATWRCRVFPLLMRIARKCSEKNHSSHFAGVIFLSNLKYLSYTNFIYIISVGQTYEWWLSTYTNSIPPYSRIHLF